MSIFRAIMDGLAQNSAMVRYVYTLSSNTVGVPPDAAIQAYLDAMWSTAMLANVSTSWSNQRVIIETPSAGHWGYVHEFVYSKAGTNAGVNDVLPNQVAAVVVGITASRRRGKKFIYGMVEGNQGGGVWSGGLLSALQDFAEAYTTETSVDSTVLTPGVVRSDGTDFLEFNGFRVDSVAGTQRRRKQGVGK